MSDDSRMDDFGELIRPSRLRYRVLGWLCLAAMISYLCRNSLAAAESTIRDELDLSEQQMGWVLSAFFGAYAAMQLPGGWLATRLGSRRALPIFALAWSLATAAMAGAFGVVLLVGSRLANGVAQAGLFPGCTGTIARWFPATERARANGALGSFMSVGQAIGAPLAAILLPLIGWRLTFGSFGLLGCVWAAGFYLWFRNEPEEHGGVNAAERELILAGRTEAQASGEHEPTPWCEMFTSPAMFCICGQQFFRAAGLTFFASWFATYLQQTRGITVQNSGLLTTLPLLATVIGGLLGGYLSDLMFQRTGSLRWARQGTAVISLVTCSLMIVSAYFVEDGMLAVLVISFGMFCFALGGPCAYTITIDMGGRHVGTVFSTMNMCGNFGAMAFPVIVPYFRQATGSWESVLPLFAATFFIAALFWLLLKPEGTVFEQSPFARSKPKQI